MEQFVEKIKTDDEFMKVWGELGPTYGKQWRQWQGWVEHYSDGKKHLVSIWFDQILELINNLKNNPDSRRLMVTAWNVAEVDKMTLPPCHYGFQCYTRELSLGERFDLWKKYIYQWNLGAKDGEFKNMLSSEDDLNKNGVPKRALSLKWQQRSVDTFLGLPFNIASYGLLLSILANECNMVPDELIGDLGDTHLYLNHIEQAKEQIVRESFPLPELKININPSLNSYSDFKPETWSPNDFEILNYHSQQAIKADLSN